MPWGAMPEGWCRNYTDALQTCKKRFGPDKPVGTEGPHGRDYFGGDLAGVTQKLAYLKSLGVTVIYLNPIFWAGSNHRYDTRDYTKIDPYLGKQADFVKMVKAAHKNGIKVLLDGVFNHMSSDSPMFDRYHNWPGTGACEQTFSKFRGFFQFRPPAAGEPSPCAPHDPAKDSYYESWFNFNSLPQLTENFGVKQYIYDSAQSAARKWLKLGADGWRLDVMQSKSIDFWHGFKAAVDKTKANTPIVGELWKKFDVLPYVYGDTATSSMDYRFRDAVVSLLAPHPFDSKGFPGSGNPIPPSQFVSRMESIREDYPDAVYWTLMNLVDSHDTERLLWTLSPGDENAAQREHTAANLAEGKAADEARGADPDDDAGRADDLLRRRGRRLGRRRPGRPPHVSLGRREHQEARRHAQARHGDARVLHAAREDAEGQRCAPRRPAQVPADGRRGRCARVCAQVRRQRRDRRGQFEQAGAHGDGAARRVPAGSGSSGHHWPARLFGPVHQRRPHRAGCADRAGRDRQRRLG